MNGDTEKNIDREVINAAIEVLKAGGVILYPTDTIWGIGCDATNSEAVAKVLSIKHRADSKSLITLVSDTDMLARYVKEIPDIALDLIEVNDSPMTIIYPEAVVATDSSPAGSALAPNVVSEDGSVGIRIPDNAFCKALISRFGRAIVSTSANLSGNKAPAIYSAISEEIIKSVDWVADPSLESASTGKASQIIKVGLRGEIAIIRS
ncbi:MAG TPA: L-threonylcarbamoyladenylate synthase [Bacteroidales bacterium]|jgi:L-threonylcarbamoyladenylate synthase|nr:threonylcarbamoyl-AMP synthase [Bacteroidales bacterium]HKM12417.1 L-threonylcarbamoyladenylate synthase [Bacteroidales bacterium]HPB89179.1 L-threonylcarbamoyladenylate synthase [Bacteroidales bacterium]HPY21828.1 L-threonylcarbamoyladenylate synthase [Bacteroidales bacterium]HQA93490.1 L-threonylcarbamoyladenylate synthase [Bacteroidales bacterium]